MSTGGGRPRPDRATVNARAMATQKLQSLIHDIQALSDAERQELAHEVLPWLLTTRAGPTGHSRRCQMKSSTP